MSNIRVESHDYVLELSAATSDGSHVWQVGQPNKNKRRKLNGDQKVKLVKRITKRGFILLRSENGGNFLVYGRTWVVDEEALNGIAVQE